MEEVVRYAYFQQLLENVIKSVKPYPDELIRRKLSDLEIIVPLCRLYNLVDLMAYGYCSWTSRQVRSWAKPQDEDDGSFEHFRSFEISVSDLSRYEYARVQRAFFYFEIHRRFFADLEHDAECYWTAEEKQKVNFKEDTVYFYLKETERRELRSVTAYLIQGMKDCYNTHYNFMINRLLPQVELKIHGKPYFDDSSEAGIDSEVVDDNESTTNSYEASGENDIGICDEGTVSEDKADEDNAVGVGDKSVVDRDEADGDNEVEKNGESVNSSVKADSGKEDDDSSNSDLNSNYGEGDSDSDDSESDDNESNVEDNKVRFGSLLFRKSDIDATFKSASDWLSEGSLVKCCDSETCDHGIGDHDDPSLTQENCASLVHDSGLPYSYRAADFARRVSALKRIKITLLVEAGLPFCRLMFLGHRGYNIRLALILQYCISRKNRDPTYKAMFSADGTMVPDSDEGDEVAASTPAVSAAGGVSKGSDPLHPGALASSSSSSPSSSGAPPQSPSSPKPISEDDARQGTHLLSSDDIAERVAPVVRRYTGHYIWDASRLTGYRCELAGALVAFGWWRGINISVSDYKLGWHCLDAGVSPRALFILADALTETTRPYQPRLEEVMRQWDYLPLP